MIHIAVIPWELDDSLYLIFQKIKVIVYQEYISGVKISQEDFHFLLPIQFESWDAKLIVFSKVLVSLRVLTRTLPLQEFPIGPKVSIYTLGRNAGTFPSTIFDYFRQVDLILLSVSHFSTEFYWLLQGIQ